MPVFTFGVTKKWLLNCSNPKLRVINLDLLLLTTKLDWKMSFTKLNKLRSDFINYLKLEESTQKVHISNENSIYKPTVFGHLHSQMHNIANISEFQPLCTRINKYCEDEDQIHSSLPMNTSYSSQFKPASTGIHSNPDKNPQSLSPKNYGYNLEDEKNQFHDKAGFTKSKGLFDKFHNDFSLENIPEAENVITDINNNFVNNDEGNTFIKDQKRIVKKQLIGVKDHKGSSNVRLVRKSKQNQSKTLAENIAIKTNKEQNKFQVYTSLNESLKPQILTKKFIIPTCMGNILLRCKPVDYKEERRLVIGRTNKAAALLRSHPEEPRGRRYYNRRLFSTRCFSPYFLQLIATRISKVQQDSCEHVLMHLNKYNQIRELLEYYDIELRPIRTVSQNQNLFR